MDALERRRVVYRWDLDKTYLRTEFDTVRDLISRAFEKPADKRTVPGAAPLLRELRATEPGAIFILSGSPEQMRRVLEAKLRLDGISWDAFTLKPSLRQLMRGRFGFLRDQVGYKLGAMLGSREGLSVGMDEILFGDDAETDVFVYSLYADVCAGRVSRDVLAGVLERAAVDQDEIPRLLATAARLPKRDHCRRIFIHLDRMSSLDRFVAYGRRVCPFYNYFQPAVVLLEMGALDAAGVLRVAAELVIDQAFTPEALAASYVELARRGQIGESARQALVEALGDVGDREYATATPVLRELGRELREVNITSRIPEPSVDELDYVALLRSERERARLAKRRVLGRL